QVTADGRQPYELARTRSLAYSVMNLEGLCRLAELARHVGVDLWSYRSARGGSIRKALDYLAPYVDPRRKWPGRQITPTEAGVLAGCEARGAPEGSWRPRALTPDQAELVAAIAEQILPETDTPGARAVGVHRFIGALLAESYSAEQRERFVAGLADLGRAFQT